MFAQEELERLLAFARMMVRMQRIEAELPDGSRGNLVERAFFDGLIGLWRAQHDAALRLDRMVLAALVKPLAGYIESYPEDYESPEILPFQTLIEDYCRSDDYEVAQVREGHATWLAAALTGNEQLTEYLELLYAVRSVKRDIAVPGRSYPEENENDAEHSVQLALAVIYLALTLLRAWRLDIALLAVMALVHDLVEGVEGVGDTPARGDPAWQASKLQREEMGLQHIKSRFPWLERIIRDYQARGELESSQVYGLDKVIAIVMDFLSGGVKWCVTGFDLQWELDRLESKAVDPEYQILGKSLLQRFNGRIRYLKA